MSAYARRKVKSKKYRDRLRLEWSSQEKSNGTIKNTIWPSQGTVEKLLPVTRHINVQPISMTPHLFENKQLLHSLFFYTSMKCFVWKINY